MRTSARFALSLASISVVIWNRIGSSSSSRPVKQTVLPLCGVAEAKMRCSNRKRISRSIRVRWLARLPLCGAKWWHFVHDQQIPRGVGRRAVAIGLGIGTGTGCLKELLQHVGHSQVVHRRDDAWECLPRVRVDAQVDGEAGRSSRSR